MYKMWVNNPYVVLISLVSYVGEKVSCVFQKQTLKLTFNRSLNTLEFIC